MTVSPQRQAKIDSVLAAANKYAPKGTSSIDLMASLPPEHRATGAVLYGLGQANGFQNAGEGMAIMLELFKSDQETGLLMLGLGLNKMVERALDSMTLERVEELVALANERAAAKSAAQAQS